MSVPDDPVAVVEQAQRRRGYIYLAAGVAFALLTSGVGIAVNEANDANDKANAARTDGLLRDQKIANLEEALQAQRKQFEDCKDKKSNAPGCTEAVAPPPGDIGPQGVQGLQGVRGEPGETGPAGQQGPQGLQGVRGQQGPPGPVGDTGAPGVDGTNGTNGLPGKDGSDGLPGKDGATGATGATGPTGPQGPQGEKGETGAEGPQGPIGPQGPPVQSFVFTYGLITYTCSDKEGDLVYECEPSA